MCILMIMTKKKKKKQTNIEKKKKKKKNTKTKCKVKSVMNQRKDCWMRWMGVSWPRGNYIYINIRRNSYIYKVFLFFFFCLFFM